MRKSVIKFTESMNLMSLTNDRVESEILKVDKRLNAMDNVLHSTDNKYTQLLSKYNDLQERVLFLECQSRSSNILFAGIPESPFGNRESFEDCKEKVMDVLRSQMAIDNADNIQFLRCQRLGAPVTSAGSGPSNRPRTILCQFKLIEDRNAVWEARSKLKNSAYSIMEDFPKEILDRRKTLLPIMHAARRQNHIAYLVGDKLHVISGSDAEKKRDVYDTKSLNKLPKSLDPRHACIEKKDNVIAFFGMHCPLSNFHHAPFRSEGHNYRHVEEYLFVKKAEFAKDDIAKQRILNAKTPAECKSIGRKILVNQKNWYAAEIKIMGKALYEKFSQNKHLKDYLMSTGDFILAEASPTDKFWGTGVGLGQVATTPIQQWPGRNKLGELLMDLRKHFK